MTAAEQHSSRAGRKSQRTARTCRTQSPTLAQWLTQAHCTMKRAVEYGLSLRRSLGQNMGAASGAKHQHSASVHCVRAHDMRARHQRGHFCGNSCLIRVHHHTPARPTRPQSCASPPPSSTWERRKVVGRTFHWHNNSKRGLLPYLLCSWFSKHQSIHHLLT